MACLQIYRELLSLTTFLRVHWNSKEVSYLSWQNTYPNLKTTCLIKLKFFLWTKLLENLLLAKYLISVAAPLIINKWHNLCAIIIFDSSGLTRLILHLVFCFFFSCFIYRYQNCGIQGKYLRLSIRYVKK